MTKADTPSTEIVVPGVKQVPMWVRNPAPLPQPMTGLIDLKGWIDSLLNRVDYIEPVEGYMAQRMLIRTFMSTDVDELLRNDELDGLQKILPDVPGATTGDIGIDDIYVAPSQLDESKKTFILLTYTVAATGLQVTTSGGSAALQSKLCGLLCMGVWPIEGQIVRLKNKDKGGRHLLTFVPCDV